MENVNIDPLLPDGEALLNFFYQAVNTNRYDDAKTLINSTSLWRIVSYVKSSANVRLFPDDATQILREFLIKVTTTTIETNTRKNQNELIEQRQYKL